MRKIHFLVLLILLLNIKLFSQNKIDVENIQSFGIDSIENKFHGWYFITICNDPTYRISYSEVSIPKIKSEIKELDSIINIIDCFINAWSHSSSYKKDSILLKNTIVSQKTNIKNLTQIRFNQDNESQMFIANQLAYERDLKKILIISLSALIW